MRVLSIVHQPDAGPGVFVDAMRSRGVTVENWMIAQEPLPPAEATAYDAVFSFGGAMHADQEDDHPWLRSEKDFLAGLLERGTPLMGVCLGTQILGEAAGVRAQRASQPEIGWFEVELTPEGEADPVLGRLGRSFEAFQWHSYEVPTPPGATALASSPVCNQAYRIGESAWGIQFHPEVSAEDAETWTRDYRVDPDAVAIGLDPEVLRAQTATRIRAWNETGRRLCERFVEFAANGSGRLS